MTLFHHLALPCAALLLAPAAFGIFTEDTTFTPAVSGDLTSMVQQSDGKIVVSQASGTQRILRLNVNGSQDTTFRCTVSGTVSTLALTPAGKIMVSGTLTVNTSSRSLIRLNTDGSVDSTFATFSGGNFSSVVLVQPDGKLITSVGAGLVRFTANGAADSTFSMGTVTGSVRSAALLPDGKILVGGTFSGSRYLIRLNTNGSLDSSFTSVLNATCQSLVPRMDGKIMAAGQFSIQSGGRFYRNLVRLNADGSLDTTFYTSISSLSSSATVPMVVLTSGDLIFQPNTTGSSIRLTSTGDIDSSWINTPSGTISSIAVQSNGAVLLGGLMSYKSTTRRLVRSVAASSGTTTPMLVRSPDGTSIHGLPGVAAPVCTEFWLEAITAPGVKIGTVQAVAGTNGFVATGLTSAQTSAAQLRLVGVQRFGRNGNSALSWTVTLSDWPTVQFVSNNYLAAEGTVLQVPLSLTRPIGVPVTVQLRTGGTVSQPLDYLSGSVVTFPAFTTAASLPVTVFDNGLKQTETRYLKLILESIDQAVTTGPTFVTVVEFEDNDDVPIFNSLPAHQVLVRGQALVFSGLDISSAGKAKCQIFRNGVPVGKAFAFQPGKDIVISQTADSEDAGSYTIHATNQIGTAKSSPVYISVYDPASPKVYAARTGGSLTLRQSVWGPGLISWRDTIGGVIPNATRPSLTLSNLTPLNAGDYVCYLHTDPNNLTESPIQLSSFSVLVSSLPPEPQLENGDLRVGVFYQQNLAYNTDPVRAPASWRFSNLPPGLRYNAQTASIEGYPERAGTYRVLATATNPSGSTSATMFLNVLLLPAGLAGQYACQLPQGFLSLTLSSSGVCTGTLHTGTGNYPFTGHVSPTAYILSDITALEFDGPPLTILDAIVPLSLDWWLIEPGRWGFQSTYSGWRAIKPSNARTYAGAWTMGLLPEQPSDFVPQGNGWGRIVVDSAGRWTLSGRSCGDGAYTCTGFLGEDGELGALPLLWGGRGTLMLRGQLAGVLVSGGTLETRDGDSPAERQLAYSMNAKILGSRYQAPPSGTAIPGLPHTSGAANVTLSLPLSPSEAVNWDMPMELRGDGQGINRSTGPTTAPDFSKFSWHLDRSTGLFTTTWARSFAPKDYPWLVQRQTIRGTGILVQNFDGTFQFQGCGHAMIYDLATEPPNLNNTLLRSWPISLTPLSTP